MTNMQRSISNNQPTVVLIFLAAALPSYLLRLTIFSVPTTFFEVCLWLTFVYALGRGWLSWQFWKTDPLRLPITLILAGSLLGVVAAPDRVLALGQWKAVIADGLIFYWLIGSLANTQSSLTRVIDGAVFGGLLIAIHALFIAPALGQVAADGRVLGVYAFDVGASPNYLALYLAPLASYSILRFFLALRSRSSVLYLLSSMFMAVALIASGSRAGLVALAGAVMIGLVWTAYLRWPKQKVALLSLVSLSIVLFGLIFGRQFLPNPSIDPSTANRLTSSNNVRWEIWKTSREILVHSDSRIPIWLTGVGLGNYQIVFASRTAGRVNYPEYITPYALHPHNFFLASWFAVGLLGLAGWLCLFVLLIRFIPGLALWQVPIVVAILAWLIHGLVDTPFYKNDLAPLFWLLAAGIVAVGAYRKTVSSPERDSQ